MDFPELVRHAARQWARQPRLAATAVLTLGLFLLGAMVSGVLRPGAGGLGRMIANLSPLYQYQLLSAGLLAPGSMLYFPAVTVLAFALTLRGVDLIKWRG